MTHDRLDFFIERLLWHLHDRYQVELTADIIKLAQADLEKEDEEQVKIENQALDDVHYQDRYGKD